MPNLEALNLMLKMIKPFMILIIVLTISGISFAQKSVDFMVEARQTDFSDLWTIDSILTENTHKIERKQPLGYIGDDFQRINIHFISVIQNPDNPSEYLVFGKTRVKNNICDFQGTLKISSAILHTESDLPPLKQGSVEGEYKFFEDRDQIHTGFFSGHFKTDFYFDQNEKLQYDALSWSADGYKNNQFEGTWTEYKSGKMQKCNWGDYRIPDSRKLDTGAAEFGVDEKYYDSGWKDYNLAWGYSPDKPGVKEAREKEMEKWWIENK